MIIGFTGTQSGMVPFQKEEFKRILLLKECFELINGDCIGADTEAILLALEVGVRTFTIIPQNSNTFKRAWNFTKKGLEPPSGRYHEITVGDALVRVRWFPPKPALKRNQDIVDMSVLMIATPKEYKHEIRSGTWATIRYAWKIKKDVIIIPPVERPEKDKENSSGSENESILD